MKKLVSIVLVLTMLTGLLGMLSGCGGPKGTVERCMLVPHGSLYNPSLLRKSLIPLSVLTPAPVNATMRWLSSIHFLKISILSTCASLPAYNSLFLKENQRTKQKFPSRV